MFNQLNIQFIHGVALHSDPEPQGDYMYVPSTITLLFILKHNLFLRIFKQSCSNIDVPAYVQFDIVFSDKQILTSQNHTMATQNW